MARTKRLTVVVTACVLALSLSAPARVIYVDDDANGLNDGSSWANAYQFLQDALADASRERNPSRSEWRKASTSRIETSLTRKGLDTRPSSLYWEMG